jgi:hypothetical protein
MFKAQLALSLNQRQLAHLLGSSERTVQRWYAKRATVYPDHITRLAVAVHPHDPDIARRLAATMGETLESLGLVAPPLPAPVVPSPQPSPSPSPPERSPFLPLLVESVVSAAAEALDVSPRAARPAVLAAVERAKVAGLSVDDLLAALRPPAQGKRARS